MRLVKLLALGAAMVALGMGPAKADVITTDNAPGTTLTIDASCVTGTGCNGGNPSSTVSAEAVLSNFVFSGVDNSTLTFSVSLTNTTQQGSLSTAVWQGIDLTAFGFNTTPVTTATGGDMMFLIVNDEEFPGFGKLQVCATSGNTCAGGQNDGLFPNQTDLFNITLTGLSGMVDLGASTTGGPETYDFKIAGSIGSFEFSGMSGGCVPVDAPPCLPITNPPLDVPEPGSLVMLGSALLGLGGVGWYRRRQGVAAAA